MNDNLFKFTLYQENTLFYERTLDASLITPFTRRFIDIRKILPDIISTLQRLMSKNDYNIDHYIGKDKDSNQVINNYYQYYIDNINTYPDEIRNELKYDPESITRRIENIVIRGVEFKIGFYINDKTIVEREFYVDRFNIKSKWSTELIETCDGIVSEIFELIKDNDVSNMWDDYNLINKGGYNISRIREMSDNERTMQLNRI